MKEFSLVLLLHCLHGLLVGSSVLWNEQNCNLQGANDDVVYGTPTDAICCNQFRDPLGKNSSSSWNECSKLDSADKCDMNDRCLWILISNGAEGTCRENRDAVNNVCCRPDDVMENCQAILNGICPAGWAVPRECCPPPYDKYDQRLGTGSDDTVCCNAPCTAMKLAFDGDESQGLVANKSCGLITISAKYQELSNKCAPGARSALNGMNLFGGNSINPFLMSQIMKFPVTNPMKAGQSNPFFSHLESMLGSKDFQMMDQMKESVAMWTDDDTPGEEVEEITVDDFFSSLVDALDNDDDVFQYRGDVLSSTKTGKMQMGGFNPFNSGLLGMMNRFSKGGSGGYSFPNAMTNFLNPMHSNVYSKASSPLSNLFGVPLAQYKYGGYFGNQMSSFNPPAQGIDYPSMEHYGLWNPASQWYNYNNPPYSNPFRNYGQGQNYYRMNQPYPQSSYPSYNWNYGLPPQQPTSDPGESSGHEPEPTPEPDQSQQDPLVHPSPSTFTQYYPHNFNYNPSTYQHQAYYYQNPNYKYNPFQ